MHNQHSPTHRYPIGLIAGAAIAACLLVGAILAWIAWNMALELRIFIGALFAGAVAWLYAAVVVYVRRNQPKYIDREYDTQQILAARSQGLPASITSLNYHDSHKDIPMQLPPPVIEGEIVRTPVIPTFGQLLDQGLIGPGKPLILGYNADSGEPIRGSFKDLYSCGIGALQGAGKSWLQAFLLAQSAAAGGRLIICDPHAGADESLSTRIAALAGAFMMDVASTDDEILTALRYANDKLERRKAGKGGEFEILIAVDEWSSLLRGKLGDELPALVQNITEQGRKYHTNALLSAQGWTVDAAGIVRNRLTAHYVLRQRDAEARYQLGLKATQLPGDIRTLPDATGYLLTVRGELTKVIIPMMTSADIARAGEMIPSPRGTQPAMGFLAPTTPLTPITASVVTQRRHDGDIKATSAAQVTTASQSPEAARALALLHEGRDLPAIVLELRNVKPKEGRKYMTALADVTDLIRQATKGGAS